MLEIEKKKISVLNLEFDILQIDDFLIIILLVIIWLRGYKSNHWRITFIWCVKFIKNFDKWSASAVRDKPTKLCLCQVPGSSTFTS